MQDDGENSTGRAAGPDPVAEIPVPRRPYPERDITSRDGQCACRPVPVVRRDRRPPLCWLQMLP
jgi:hypothetical protein